MTKPKKSEKALAFGIGQSIAAMESIRENLCSG